MNQSSFNNSELPEQSQNISESDNLVNHGKRSVEGNNNQVVQADSSSVNQLNLQNSNNNTIVQENHCHLLDLSDILNKLADFKKIVDTKIQ